MALLLVGSLLFGSVWGLVVSAEEGTPVAAEESASETEPTDAGDAPTDAAVPAAPPGESPVAEQTEEEIEAIDGVEPAEPQPAVADTVLPSLQIDFSDQMLCSTADEEQAVPSGGAIEFHCVNRVTVASTGLGGDSLSIGQTIEVQSLSNWTIQFSRFPSAEEVASGWSQPGVGIVEYRQFEEAIVASDDDVKVVDFDFLIRLTRPVCSPDVPIFELQRSAGVQAEEISAVSDEAADGVAVRLAPNPVCLPEPSVRFTGPLELGALMMNGADATETRQAGSLGVVIEGLNQACGEWALSLHANNLIDSEGTALPGSMLLYTGLSTDAESGGQAGDPCDLATGCQIRTLATGSEGPDTVELSIPVELVLTVPVDPGRFQASVTAELEAVSEDA